MAKHGIDKTLEEYGSKDPKLNRRKLKSWIENKDKVKGTKGRKTSDA